VASYTAVILAAGCGKRMGELGRNHPKALLPIGDAPVVEHQLRMLRDLGVRSASVVVGYRAADVVRYLGDGDGFGVKLSYFEQPRQLGSAHALNLVRSNLTKPFLLLLGDYFFLADAPERLVARLDNGGSAIMTKCERDPRLIAEGCELITDQTGQVIELVEKPVRPRGNLKGCGFYSLQPPVVDYVARTPRTALRNEYEVTVALDLFVKAGHQLYAEQMEIWDHNFTYPSDVLKCNLEWLRRRGVPHFVDDGAVIENGAILERAVVGSGARISRGAALTDVVVFPGALVPPGETIRSALVTPYGTHATSAVPVLAT
jgi:NDP-sugar pyrophosphorylase family protein